MRASLASNSAYKIVDVFWQISSVVKGQFAFRSWSMKPTPWVDRQLLYSVHIKKIILMFIPFSQTEGNLRASMCPELYTICPYFSLFRCVAPNLRVLKPLWV